MKFNFGIQILLAVFIASCVCVTIIIYKYKKYRKIGRSIKNLEIKVVLMFGMPIVSIPVLMSSMTVQLKIMAILTGIIAAIAYSYAVVSARKAYREMMGLPPEDDDTGEVIRDDKKT